MVTKLFICPNGHRWRNGDDDKRCPECGAEAAETIGNGNPQLGSTGTGKTGPFGTTPAETELPKFGRYKVIEEIGRGGMGIVYRAFDPVQEREVALKTLPSTDPALLTRFKREFRALADVDHPNVVKLFELTSDGATWFFTMEIIDGVDLLYYVEHGLPQPPNEVSGRNVEKSDPTLTEEINLFELSQERLNRIRDGFTQLAGAIAALHASGVIHRDIKPSNVIVTPAGRVVLLDFGLVAETDPSGLHQSLHQQVMGTVAYMSPEQAACDPVSAASDWYAVGVMLYETLTGKLPFAGKALDVLVSKQHQDPVPPCKIASYVSQDWNALCVDLLCRDPETRPGGQDVLRRLDRQPHQSVPKKRPQPEEVALVGRETQLQSLRETWQAVRSGQPKCVFVEGASGTGKSALVDAFVGQATRDGAVALQSRCYEMESVPFKAVDGLVDALVAFLIYLSESDAAALMPRDVHALASVFPVIGQVEAVASLPRRPIDVSDQKELNRRAIGALRELLARLSDRYPLIVYIDDLQWGDQDSAAMLSDLLQPPDSPVLLFLGTCRSEDADTSQFLQSFRQFQRQRQAPVESATIEVTPLVDADAIALALALLQRDDRSAQCDAESIARESAGNPFFVSELVKHVQLEGERVSDSAEPLVLGDMIWSRVRRLPDESQRLLAVVALWGQPLPLDQALHIAEVGQLAVGPLRTGHLLRTLGLASSPKIETYHDRIRESVSARLEHATKQQLHLRIAEEYAHQSPLSADEIMAGLGQYFADGVARVDDYLEVAPILYEIAFHFDAANRSGLAFPYALATAEKSRSQFSLEVAEQQYRIAERAVDSRNEAVRYQVAGGLGKVLMLRGHYAEAAERFQAALELTTDPLAKARTEGELAELAFKRGDVNTAMEAIERAIGGLGHGIPNRPVSLYLRLLGEVFVQLLHSLLPRLFVGRRKLEGVEKQLLVVRLFNRLAYGYWFKRGKYWCLWAHLRGMNLAERYPPTAELAQAYSIHAPVMSLIACFSRGDAYGRKSFAIYKDLGDLWGQGQSQNFHGIVHYVAAQYDEALEKNRAAERLLERTGDLWEVNIARTHIGNSLQRKGDLNAAAELAERVHRAGIELDDIQAKGISLDTWAKASGGRVDPDILRTELNRPRDDVQVRAQVMLAEGLRLYYSDQFAEAQEVFENAQQLAEKSGVANPWSYPLRSWLASALRREVEKTSSLTPERRSALLKRAGKVVRKAVCVARKFQNDLPHALREAGLISAMQGSIRRARTYLDESLDVAKRQGARFEHAQTMLARGTVGLKLDWPKAAEEVAAARQALRELGADFVLEQLGTPDEAEVSTIGHGEQD